MKRFTPEQAAEIEAIAKNPDTWGDVAERARFLLAANRGEASAHTLCVSRQKKAILSGRDIEEVLAGTHASCYARPLLALTVEERFELEALAAVAVLHDPRSSIPEAADARRAAAALRLADAPPSWSDDTARSLWRALRVSGLPVLRVIQQEHYTAASAPQRPQEKRWAPTPSQAAEIRAEIARLSRLQWRGVSEAQRKRYRALVAIVEGRASSRDEVAAAAGWGSPVTATHFLWRCKHRGWRRATESACDRKAERAD